MTGIGAVASSPGVTSSAWYRLSQSASGIDGGERKRDDGVAECGAVPWIPAGGDDDELAPAGDVGHWRRLAASRQRRLPEFATGVDIEGAQLLVCRRGGWARCCRPGCPARR